MRFFSKFKPFMICMVSTVFLLSACGKPTVSTPEKHEIPVPEGYETSQDDLGADAFQSLLDNPQSKYFTINDYYNMKSEGSLRILPEDSLMVPYSQNLEGAHGGYIFVPIDGQSYRYNVANVLPEDTKGKDKIFEFVETDDWGNELNWTIYTLSEDPSCQTLMGDTGRLGILELAYAPALGSTQADIQDARNAGFVMMKDDEPEKDDGKWETFAAKCENGEAAEIRLGFIYTKEGLNMSEDLAAATADNYPALFLSELRFDGTQYTISPLGRLGEEYVVHERKGIDSPVQTFAYMLHLDDPDAERYVLVNDPTLTWERIWQGMLSSTLGDQVEYRMVYHRTKTNK